MFYNEDLYYLLCSCTNPISGKILVPEIWTKIYSANQIPGFFNQHISRTNQWNSPIFHVDTNLHKLKVDWEIFWMGVTRNGCGQFGHRTLKLAVSQKRIDEMNWLFAWWCKFRKAKSYFNDFWVGMVKNGRGHLVHEVLKSAE